MRSVRAAEAGNNAPPLKRASERPPSVSRYERCSGVWRTLLARSSDLGGQAGGRPLGKAILEASRLEAPAAEQRHCLRRKSTVGPPAVGDDLSILRKLVEPPQQLAEGNRDGPGQVSRSELVTGANVEDQEVLTSAQAAAQDRALRPVRRRSRRCHSS